MKKYDIKKEDIIEIIGVMTSLALIALFFKYGQPIITKKYHSEHKIEFKQYELR